MGGVSEGKASGGEGLTGGAGGGSSRSGASDGGSGRNPDLLIREIAENLDRPVTGAEIDRILEHVAGAPFDPEERRVRRGLRGLSYQGYDLRETEYALITHLLQRVLVDRQWREGATARQYLEDLRAAVRHPSARVAVGTPEGSEPLVYVFADNPVPEDRRGTKPERFLFVLYATYIGAIITGYQTGDASATRLPENVRWLR